MDSLTHSASVVVQASPEELYDLVSDVTRTGEWSPVCRECRWDEGATGSVGDWFTGHNDNGLRQWDTRSQVVAAERGREFAWMVGEGWIRWGYSLAPAAGGTELTESWEFLPGGLEFFEERFGDGAPAQIADRVEKARTGIPQTLAAIKRAAEADG